MAFLSHSLWAIFQFMCSSPPCKLLESFLTLPAAMLNAESLFYQQIKPDQNLCFFPMIIHSHIYSLVFCLYKLENTRGYFRLYFIPHVSHCTSLLGACWDIWLAKELKATWGICVGSWGGSALPFMATVRWEHMAVSSGKEGLILQPADEWPCPLGVERPLHWQRTFIASLLLLLSFLSILWTKEEYGLHSLFFSLISSSYIKLFYL